MNQTYKVYVGKYHTLISTSCTEGRETLLSVSGGHAKVSSPDMERRLEGWGP